jgi:hypothetical protein
MHAAEIQRTYRRTSQTRQLRRLFRDYIGFGRLVCGGTARSICKRYLFGSTVSDGRFFSQALLLCCPAVSAQEFWATKQNVPVALGNDGRQAGAAVGSCLHHCFGTPSSSGATATKDTSATGTRASGTARAPWRAVCLGLVR